MSIIKVFGKKAEILKKKKIVIVGVGGLGCTVANLLARMKVPIIIVDNDIVDDSNLERQLLFDTKDLLKYKVDVVEDKLKQFTYVKKHNEILDKKNVDELFSNADLVIDCTDNVETRLLINDYCKKNKIDWIYSGAVGNIGVVFFIDSKNTNAACYQCINQEKDGDTSCEIGVLNTIVTLTASMTVDIAINYLINNTIEDKMIRLNNHSMTKIQVKKNPKCNACKARYKYL